MMLASWEAPWGSVWPLGAVLVRSWGLLEHLGIHLEASCAILSHLGGYLGLSEALLEPSWAILDVPTTRETPRPGPGEGVGGGVNPSPKGKKGVGRGSSLDHRRPEGWWDCNAMTCYVMLCDSAREVADPQETQVTPGGTRKHLEAKRFQEAQGCVWRPQGAPGNHLRIS